MSDDHAPTVLITGASTGIGEACAQRFHQLGYRVIAGVRKEADGLRLQASTSSRLTWVLLDVTDPNSLLQAAELVRSVVGADGLAALVNNAGIVVGGPLEYLPLALVRLQFEVNVVGLVAVTQSFLPALRMWRGSGGARIVNIGSIAGRTANPFIGPYAASKHAVEAITDALRGELNPWGIQVAVIEPGAVATPIWDKGKSGYEALFDELPAVAKEQYGRRLLAFRRLFLSSAKRAVPAGEVADAVEHAITSADPRTRYLVGKDAKLRLLLRLVLPDRLQDALILTLLRRLER